MLKIVLTGGPCAGKSSALAVLRTHFEEQGYTVLTVPETATELIKSGITPQNCGSRVDFQRAQMRLQYAKEQTVVGAARSMPTDRILIIFDRGAFDSLAYMPREPFDRFHAEIGVTPEERMCFYDGIFHLVTAAEGARAFYTTKNNTARTETPEEAIALDGRILAVWQAHPCVCVIGNDGDFETKLCRLITAVDALIKKKEACCAN